MPTKSRTARSAALATYDCSYYPCGLDVIGTLGHPAGVFGGVASISGGPAPDLRRSVQPRRLAGATDADGDTLRYHIDGVTQDEYATGVGDDTSPDAALTAAGADSNQVLVRSEANSHFEGRVYRIAFSVTDGRGGVCSASAGTNGTTAARVGVSRRRGTAAIDGGGTASWDSFSGSRAS